MRVGVFYRSHAQDSGGEYTFRAELFQSLLAYAGESSHTFVIFVWSQDIHFQQQPFKNVEFVYLHRNILRVLLFIIYDLTFNLLHFTWLKLRFSSGKFRVKSDHERFVLKTLEQHRIDLLWQLGPGTPTTEVPYITTVWDLQHRLQSFFPEVSAAGQWDARESGYSRALRKASHVIVGTEVGKSEIEQFYHLPSERIRVIPFPTPQFATACEANDTAGIARKYRREAGYLFYPANFWPHKNHVCLLYALRLLREDYGVDLDLVLVGSDKGNLRYVLNLVSKLKLSDHVHHLGFVSQQDLVSLYRNAFALVFPSFFGPDNLPPLEAFSLGCPVVAANVAGAEEQLGDAAVLFRPTDWQQLAAEIREIHDNPDRREDLIRRGRQRGSRFTWRDYVHQVFVMLDEFEPIRRCWASEERYIQT